MAELTDSAREALERPNFWSLATVNPDGSPHSTIVWVHTRDGKIIVNSALGRKKPRNLEREPRVALSWHDTSPGAYRSFAIQGRVVDTILGEQADRDIDMLAKKYLGEDRYPWRRPDEQRVTYVVEPVHVMEMGR